MLRLTGFLAACLLAVVGWLGGALPSSDTASTPLTILRGPWGWAILCGWAVGTGLLGYAWWGARNRIPSARWAVGTALLWALPFLVTPPNGSRDLYSYACQGYLFVHGLNPYAVGVASLPCPWLSSVSPIWRDTAAPYGPLFVLISGWIAALGGGSLVAIVLLHRVVALGGLALVALGVPVIARRCGIPVRRALWLSLAGPLIGAQVIAGPHNDALMIGLVVAGLAVASLGGPPPSTGDSREPLPLSAGSRELLPLRAGSRGLSPLPAGSRGLSPLPAGSRGLSPLPAGSRGPLPLPAGSRGPSPLPAGSRGSWGLAVGSRRSLPLPAGSREALVTGFRGPLVAGLLIGLAVAVKVTAVVVLPFAILMVCARPYRWRQAVLSGGSVVGGALGAMVLVTGLSGLGFGWIGGLVNTHDLVQFTSPPTAVGMTLTYVGRLVFPGFDAVPAMRVLAAAGLIALFVILLLRAARVAPSAGWRRLVSAEGDPVASGLRGAAWALAATVALSPYFHPWYALWPLVLLAATTAHTRLVMIAATAGPLLVLPDGGGLARFVKFPGAPIMTVLLALLLVRHLRPRGDGPRGDGPRGDGPRGDGPRGDGPRGDGPRGTATFARWPAAR